MPTVRVLCVDDDRNILEAMRRSLKGDFELDIAVGGVEGLKRLRADGPYAVVLSDLRMPIVDGITLLRQASEICPDTVRVLLTGDGDMTAAVSAVNEGHLFRFLTKPCPAKYLLATIVAGIEQHRLLTSERVLLHETLCTSMRALADLACLVRPDVTARMQRGSRLAGRLGAAVCPRQVWVCEMGMLLLATGWVTLPEGLCARSERAGELMPSDLASLHRLPELAARLIADVPKLESVRDALGRLQLPMSASDPAEVRVLRLLWDFEREHSDDPAVAAVALTALGHDPSLVRRFEALLSAEEHHGPTREVRLADLAPGMVLAESVFDEEGALLISRGTEVGPGLVEHIHHYWNEAARGRLTQVRDPGHELPAAA